MQYCSNCEKDVETKTSYGKSVWITTIITLVIGAIICAKLFHISGIWATIAALIAARIAATGNRTYKCSVCEKPLNNSKTKQADITLESPNEQSTPDNQSPSTDKKPDITYEEKRLKRLEKHWYSSHEEPLPQISKDIIMNGGKLTEAYNAGKKELGEPTGFFGSLKHSYQKENQKNDKDS